MVNWKSKKLGDILTFLNGLLLITLVNMLVSSYFYRIDLTEEKRYTIKDQTREILINLDDNVYVEIFLDGDLNAEFRRLQKGIEETLEEFRIYSRDKVKYKLTNPTVALSGKARSEFMTDLAAKGIQPTNVIDTKSGERTEQLVFPGVTISYEGMEVGVMLLKGNKAGTPAEEINQSIEGIEYELASAINKLVNTDRRRIGFVTGHGELDSLHIASFNNDLREVYDAYKLALNEGTALRMYDALIVAKPSLPFSTLDKYILDQYIMQGGKVMFLIDKMEVSMDSASRDDYFALPYNINLDDQLFRYGVRINMDLIQDRSAGFYPVITGQIGGKPQVKLMDWPFYPLLNHYADHPITRNLDAVITRFVSSVDTVKATGVRKTPLVMTSQYTRTLTAPVKVSVNDLRKKMPDDTFSKRFLPVGYLLEGKFTSLFKNRFLPEGASEQLFREESVPTKIIVVADGDIVRNDINMRSGQPRPLGFDPATNYTFANRDFLMNALAHLLDENGLIQARNRQVKIRPLDKEKVINERMKWQMINLIVPLVLLVLYGVGRAYWRKRKYARF
ncbi:MAG: gliding motility-associated ABC transporter substrate-binding protein GldG [Cyclobacteriaceae bacterium]|nr:gliding motility-associated ABC transporter substrate-binding protein GldG [Cyclobacteriaceae bacterium]MDH4297752.1 gliding motility-associated ABC transporter substrate-binding protein GldG [Cyclobacteriaceae bacterium]